MFPVHRQRLRGAGDFHRKGGRQQDPLPGACTPSPRKRDMMHRHNSTFLGKFQGLPVMGFKSQFHHGLVRGQEPGPIPGGKGRGPEQEVQVRGGAPPQLFRHLPAGAPCSSTTRPLPSTSSSAWACRSRRWPSRPWPSPPYDARLKDFQNKT